MKNKRVDNDGGKTGRSYATTSLVRAESLWGKEMRLANTANENVMVVAVDN